MSASEGDRHALFASEGSRGVKALTGVAARPRRPVLASVDQPTSAAT